MRMSFSNISSVLFCVLMLCFVCLSGADEKFKDDGECVINDIETEAQNFEESSLKADKQNIECAFSKSIFVNGREYRAIKKIGDDDAFVMCKVEDVEYGGTKGLKIIKKDVFEPSSETEAQNEMKIQQILPILPHVADVYDMENRLDVVLMVLEYLPDSVEDLMKPYSSEKNELMPVQTVSHITKEILLALKEVHEAGVVHLDVKPSNLFFTDEGHIKLTGFRISLLTAEDNTAYTISRKRVTVLNVAPELFNETFSQTNIKKCDREDRLHQLTRRKMNDDSSFDRTFEKESAKTFTVDECNRPAQVGLPADVWSFGLILYKMMYGEGAHDRLITLFLLGKLYGKDGDEFSRELKNGIDTDGAVFQEALNVWKRAFKDPLYKITFPAYENPILAKMVQDCLQRDPALRPTVKELLLQLHKS